MNLPESILLQMRDYEKEFKPKIYLFEGQFRGMYSVRSAQQVFSGALEKETLIKLWAYMRLGTALPLI